MLGQIELGPRSSGSEPWSLWVTHLPPAASHTLLGKAKSSASPQSQFLQLNQNSHGAKINVAIVGAKRHVLTMANAKNSNGRACWPAGIYRFDYDEGQRCFSSLTHKEGLVQHQDNGTSKWHVKLTWLCAIIQAFDLTNVLVPSSTSANTSTFLLPLLSRFLSRPAVTGAHKNGKKIWRIWRKEEKIPPFWRENVGPTDKFGCLAFVVWIKIKVSFSAVTLH